LPLRDESPAIADSFAVLLFPTGVAKILAVYLLFEIKQYCVVNLLIAEALATRLTGVRARLDVPIIHESLFLF
jgi:hypothetical protein